MRRFRGSLLALGTVAWPAVAAGQPSGAVVSYPIPTEAPLGAVQVLSAGSASLAAPSLIGNERFIHIRLAAHNREDEREWVLDGRDQHLELADGTAWTARFAEAHTRSGPARVTLRRGERGYLDLFFPAGEDGDPEWIMLTWLVRRGGGSVVGATVFAALSARAGDYGHYRPSQYSGGHLFLGPHWCALDWSWWTWHTPFAPYQRYRYSYRPDGYDVFDGGTLWRYDHARRPAEAPSETVGTRWRARGTELTGARLAREPASGGDAEPHRASATPAPATGAGWRLQLYRLVPPGGGAPAASPPTGVASMWRDLSPRPAPLRAESSAPPPPPAPSPSWSSSSSSSSGSPERSSPPAAPAGDTVGGRWRSR